VVRVSQLVGGVVGGGHGGKGDEVWRGVTPNVAVETTGAARGFTQGQTEGKAGGGPGAMGKCGGQGPSAGNQGVTTLRSDLGPIAVLLQFLLQ
jgi:hypothetical protein